MRSLTADGFIDGVRERGSQLAAGLASLSAGFALGEVRAAGLLVALELGRDTGPAIVAQARSAGLLLNSPRPHCLRFMPALNSSPDEIAAGLDTLRDVLARILRSAGMG